MKGLFILILYNHSWNLFLHATLLNVDGRNMTKKATIPTLTGDTYRNAYFKHQVVPGPIALSSDQYFEIRRRCLWPDIISAHRLDFYMIFIVTAGEGIHTFGSKEYYIRQNMLCFVGPHMISSWKTETEYQQGYFVVFSESFFNQGFENKLFLQQLPCFQLDGRAVLNLNEKQIQYYLTLFQFMDEEYSNTDAHSSAVLRSQLQLILQKASAQMKAEDVSDSVANRSGLRLLKGFKALYMRDFHALGKGKGIILKKIAAYANELGVSQNHLNDTIKKVTGRSAGHLVRHQMATHATMCLMHADKSISEIAFTLGFEDPSYFARFYKAQTGKSPSEFRAVRNP